MAAPEGIEQTPKKAEKVWRERARVLTAPLRRNLYKQRGMLLEQVVAIQGFMHVLMKPTNTGHAWTREELRELRGHLRTLVKLVPILVIFILPGSVLLMPILAEVLDRRKTRR
jgi:hypothetical protein